jgi:hypothetical protein
MAIMAVMATLPALATLATLAFAFTFAVDSDDRDLGHEAA